ncbi:MAG: site-specific DNA-methyltransferase [Rhodothermaceae bacterium]|nr:site-specific DNA-methyltransferase [Candidatus Dadabacteria bacterium]MYH84450.1 site-specific DNA-methyltransferase [Gammaproteobacteria bacterium]MYI83832.1 site-specific DNA-methyltransferase [Rhodothermaceae bacterium]
MIKFFAGDCLTELNKVEHESIDLIYIDPPFFTQTVHRLATRDGEKNYLFADIWKSEHEYANYIFQRLCKLQGKLKSTGSVFFHCDKSASHIIRLMLDCVFGAENFQSEIIWHFRRWSNTKRGLLNSHQTIYFYSKGTDFKFFPKYQSYSASTNIDQIMQKRSRDHRDKSVYARGEDGEVISNGTKKGVPLNDVWEIPFLNPKAKERVGYPTQKPVLLLKRIIELVTESGDTVLDPFCGSGTTLVAAKMLDRNAVGIDIAHEAVELAKQRLATPVISHSALLEKGRTSYETHDSEAGAYLQGIEYIPVQRNKGIDGLLKYDIQGIPVFIRVQRGSETQEEAAEALRKASQGKGKCLGIVVATRKDLLPPRKRSDIIFINATSLTLTELISELNALRPDIA